jgi:transposase
LKPAPTRGRATGSRRPQELCLDRSTTTKKCALSPKSSASPTTSTPAAKKPDGSSARTGYRARRWVVERSHSWLNRFRRILTSWEKRADTYLAMLHLACALITWRAANWGRLPESALRLIGHCVGRARTRQLALEMRRCRVLAGTRQLSKCQECPLTNWPGLDVQSCRHFCR